LCFQRAFEAVVWNMSYLFSDGSRVCDFSELLEEIYAPTIANHIFVASFFLRANHCPSNFFICEMHLMDRHIYTEGAAVFLFSE
jgi:hypothetical protein